MTKFWGVKFGTPGGMAVSAFSAERREQFSISAAHQLIAVGDETDRSPTQVMCLPRALRDAFGAEHGLGDCAIGGAVLARVERAQGLRQALTPLVREVICIFARSAASERAPETQSGQRPEIEEIVQRQAHFVRHRGLPLFREPQPMRSAGNP